MSDNEVTRKVQNQEKERDWLNAIVADEAFANIRKVKEYQLPLLSRLSSKPLTELRLISIGCGFGFDVDQLVNSGIDAYGIEPFSRIRMWNLRQHKGRLIIGDGRDLPFRNESFDIVLCLEVMEHVGYEGEERTKTSSDIIAERKKFAKELTRILAPSGLILVTTPNRHFPVDIGHGSNFLGVRVHSPFNDFTLSLKDIKSLFLQDCGCSNVATLPYENFITWDLYTKNYPLIRLLQPFVKTYLRLLDKLRFLRVTFLSPHLILAIKK